MGSSCMHRERLYAGLTKSFENCAPDSTLLSLTFRAFHRYESYLTIESQWLTSVTSPYIAHNKIRDLIKKLRS